MVIATSPKARSRSTRQTLRAPLSVSARARLTALVVLPTPPLGEKTVTTRPTWVAPPGPRRARKSWPARSTASTTASGSFAGTTSRAPAFIAASEHLGVERLPDQHDADGGVLGPQPSRRRSAASSRVGVGPRTTTYSSWCWSSQACIGRPTSTACEPGGIAFSSASTSVGRVRRGRASGSLLEEVGGDDAIAGLEFAVRVQQSEGQFAETLREQDLLGLVLRERQRQQRVGQHLGGRACPQPRPAAATAVVEPVASTSTSRISSFVVGAFSGGSVPVRKMRHLRAGLG